MKRKYLVWLCNVLSLILGNECVKVSETLLWLNKPLGNENYGGIRCLNAGSYLEGRNNRNRRWYSSVKIRMQLVLYSPYDLLQYWY